MKVIKAHVVEITAVYVMLLLRNC